MKCLITRVTGKESQPFASARREKLMVVDERSWPSLDAASKLAEGQKFFASGEHHREIMTDGEPAIARDITVDAWTVEISTIEDLIALVKEGRKGLIVTESRSPEAPCHIMIWDAWLS